MKSIIDWFGRSVRTGVVAVLAVLATGCATLSGVPDSSLKAPLITSQDEYTLPAECLSQAKIYYLYTKAQRNGWIDGALSCINETYDRFVTELRRSETAWGISTGIADLVFKVASSLTPSAGVKANYTAASLLVTGTDEIINKEAFLEQTVAALTAAMDANRKKALVPIITGMQGDVSAYPIGLAYEQLLAYQRAGSFIEGLKFVTANAREEEDASTRAISEIPENKALSKARTASRACLTAVLQGTAPANQGKLFAAYRQVQPDATNPASVGQLVADITMKHRFEDDEAFDEGLSAAMRNQGLTVPCGGG
jgi:hypothetical protein